jgi:hypothetical protein
MRSSGLERRGDAASPLLACGQHGQASSENALQARLPVLALIRHYRPVDLDVHMILASRSDHLGQDGNRQAPAGGAFSRA